MQDLSVVIIAKDAATTLPSVLSKVAWATEIIVVVDQASTDETFAIAQSAGAKVFKRAWSGYADQKNFGIDQATQPWILSLDDDEILSEELEVELRTLVPDEDGYYLPYKHYLGSTWLAHGGMYPDYHLRLFKRDQRFEGLVGSQIHEAVQVDNAAYFTGAIHHPTYPTVADFWQKVCAYAKAEGLAYARQGKAIKWYAILLPAKVFIQRYIWQSGWRDGWGGLINAGFLAYYQIHKLAWMVVGKYQLSRAKS